MFLSFFTTYLIIFNTLLIPVENIITYNYNIKVAGFKVGYLKATQVEKNNLTYYTILSESSIWLGKEINVRHETKCVYDKEKLVSAEIEAKTTKGDYNSSIKWDNDHYNVNIRNYNYEKKEKIYKPITYSIVKLYFEKPPVKLHEIFVEGYGEFSQLIHLTPDKYLVELTDRTRTFKYDDNKMIEAEMENPIKNFIIERSK